MADGRPQTAASSGLPQDANINVLKVSPQLPSKVYAVTATGSLYASDNSGGNWFAISGVSSAATSIDIDPIHPYVIYVGTAGGGVYKTTDFGFHWVQQNN